MTWGEAARHEAERAAISTVRVLRPHASTVTATCSEKPGPVNGTLRCIVLVDASERLEYDCDDDPPAWNDGCTRYNPELTPELRRAAAAREALARARAEHPTATNVTAVCDYQSDAPAGTVACRAMHDGVETHYVCSDHSTPYNTGCSSSPSPADLLHNAAEAAVAHARVLRPWFPDLRANCSLREGPRNGSDVSCVAVIGAWNLELVCDGRAPPYNTGCARPSRDGTADGRGEP
jgi:hypothetical protein